jgi:LemA protein
MQNSLLSVPSSRRGAIGKGCLVAGLVVLIPLALIAMVAFSGYNGLVSDQENVKQKWAQVENDYKRRYELVPNLVATVQGSADFEKSTLTEVTEARAQVGRVQMPSELPTDPAQLEAYMRAQQSLSASLGRLFAVAEAYPELKSTEGFLNLQHQLEGTENRITVAREDYTVAVRQYNTRRRKFPMNLLAGMFGFEELPQFTVPPEETAVPPVKFDTK